MVGEVEELLRRLTANDESSVRWVLAMAPERDRGGAAAGVVLAPRVRMLVRLAALVAMDASTASLQWAAELASVAGAGDDEIVGVLVAVGSEVGSACVVASAPRLALAIGYDLEVEGWDGC